jgi:LysR family transcriptional regulator, hydrogen peroxide-inducible genes activator
MGMEVHQLRYFCAVARMGSFTRAAEEEGVAQPSLSQQILKLESEMGAPLFERLGRSVRLTPCGELLLPQAHAILRQFADARQSVQGLLVGVKGRLAVGAIPTVMPYVVANRISGFLKEYPDVDLQLIENKTSSLLEALQAGDLDLAILSFPLSIPDIVCSELFREQILLAVAPSHRLAHLAAVALRELRQERLLLLREGHCFRDNALAACRKARITPNAVFESDQFASIFALVAAGAGVSLIPAMAVEGAHGCSFLPIEPESSRRIGYAHVRRQFRPPAQKAFIEWLRQSLRPLRPQRAANS